MLMALVSPRLQGVASIVPERLGSWVDCHWLLSMLVMYCWQAAQQS